MDWPLTMMDLFHIHIFFPVSLYFPFSKVSEQQTFFIRDIFLEVPLMSVYGSLTVIGDSAIQHHSCDVSCKNQTSKGSALFSLPPPSDSQLFECSRTIRCVSSWMYRKARIYRIARDDIFVRYIQNRYFNKFSSRSKNVSDISEFCILFEVLLNVLWKLNSSFRRFCQRLVFLKQDRC